MDDYDDYCDLIDEDEETVETFKDIKEEYEMWLDCYEDVRDDVFFRPKWDKEVYAYGPRGALKAAMGAPGFPQVGQEIPGWVLIDFECICLNILEKSL